MNLVYGSQFWFGPELALFYVKRVFDTEHLFMLNLDDRGYIPYN